MDDNAMYKIVNLTNGDNIIGQVIRKENSITIYRPFQMKIITMMDQVGPNNMLRQEALVMRNWLELSKEEAVEISLDRIIAITEPTTNVSKLYDEEIDKEDNPSEILSLLDKMKDMYEDEDEDVLDIDAGNDQNIMVEFEPEDVKHLIQQIIENSLNSIESNNSDNKDDPDYYDTDNDMYGW